MTTIHCQACLEPIAARAAVCPACGVRNDWLHPCIESLVPTLEQWNRRQVRANVYWGADRVWGVGWKKRPGHNRHPFVWGPPLIVISIICGMVGAALHRAVLIVTPITFLIGIIATFIGAVSGNIPREKTVEFDLDLSVHPPHWHSNDEAYWAEIRNLFDV
jgi:hypothetical protein